MRSTGMTLAAVLGLLAPAALAGGGRFVPLGNPRIETHHARDVSTNPQGVPFVMGQVRRPDGTSEAALFTIQPNGDVTPQMLTVPDGMPPRRSAWGATSGGAVVVGNAQQVAFPQQLGQAVVWNPPSEPAMPLPCLQTTKDPNDGNCECMDGFKCDACDDSRGTVIIAVGISFNDNFSVRLPTVWRSDNAWAPQQLDLLPGGLQVGSANAGNARDNGVITIVGEAVGTISEAVIWDGETGQVRKVLPRGTARRPSPSRSRATIVTSPDGDSTTTSGLWG